MRAGFVISGVAVGIRRNAAMTVALVLSTAIALGFVGAAILANGEITKFKTRYEDKLNVSIFLCTDDAYAKQVADNAIAAQSQQTQREVTCAKGQATTSAEVANIGQELRADPRVTSVQFVSMQENLNRVKQQQPDLKNYVRLGDLPASYTVKLKDISADYAPVKKKFEAVAGVDSVRNPIDVIRRLLSIIDSVRWLSIILAIIVLAASTLLIANTIQVAAAQRRNETSIMRLVGASRWMTELPFILETVLAVVLGGLISTGFIWLGKHYVLDSVFKIPVDNGVIPNLDINDVLVAGGAGLIIGVVLSALTAFATLRLYVRL